MWLWDTKDVTETKAPKGRDYKYQVPIGSYLDATMFYIHGRFNGYL